MLSRGTTNKFHRNFGCTFTAIRGIQRMYSTSAIGGNPGIAENSWRVGFALSMLKPLLRLHHYYYYYYYYYYNNNYYYYYYSYSDSYSDSYSYSE